MSVEFGQYLPNWLDLLVTAAGMVAASVAAVFAWRTFKEDRVRDARRAALGVSAAWATAHLDDEDREAWGVLVHNAASTAFHDVLITVLGNNHQRGAEPIAFKKLQPGRYFIESHGKTAQRAWGRQTVIAEHERVKLAESHAKKVQSLEFTDSLGTRWRSSTEGGLRSAPRRSQDA
ncbi:hypothetical protein [Diaminobutyricibacter sp. McL0608]|uniref:hypothetical protein n=1 Tax=Leifsonia sp. McL0608 TaxID=3143537 RepID=UPI0031F2E2B1